MRPRTAALRPAPREAPRRMLSNRRPRAQPRPGRGTRAPETGRRARPSLVRTPARPRRPPALRRRRRGRGGCVPGGASPRRRRGAASPVSIAPRYSSRCARAASQSPLKYRSAACSARNLLTCTGIPKRVGRLLAVEMERRRLAHRAEVAPHVGEVAVAAQGDGRVELEWRPRARARYRSIPPASPASSLVIPTNCSASASISRNPSSSAIDNASAKPEARAARIAREHGVGAGARQDQRLCSRTEGRRATSSSARSSRARASSGRPASDSSQPTVDSASAAPTRSSASIERRGRLVEHRALPVRPRQREPCRTQAEAEAASRRRAAHSSSACPSGGRQRRGNEATRHGRPPPAARSRRRDEGRALHARRTLRRSRAR